MQRVTAWCLRFAANCRATRKKKQVNFLTVKELDLALLTLIKLAQQQSFSEDIEYLRKYDSCKRNSAIASLNPFLDVDGLLRVGGRIKFSNFGFNKKHCCDHCTVHSRFATHGL